ncbi:(11Z)-hexadec-11-enoyl-CoA conjugase-like isoform X1 [Lasioglossum baleicum]|uniref:(11Z)-hexadec-11-enoyl-CoA conjugase-like isoform X1 n=1 Tax=Lasioglossum baleicum TaxID=434251 RepID=UPI003FCDEF5B
MDTETNQHKEDNTYEVEEVLQKQRYGTDMNYTHQLWYQRIVVHSLLQIGWVIGMYTAVYHAQIATILWGFLVAFLAVMMGIGIGAHRYLTHRSFKSTPILKLFFVIFQTMAGQNSMFTWTMDHVLHHKYSDTDADPHNSSRGFFFAHIGWLMMKKHPLLLQKQLEMDWSELTNDKLIMFQHNYFLFVYFPIAVILPVSVPVYFWNESLWNSFFVAYFLQYVTSLHITWSINSAAHMWGSKPYDTRIKAVQSILVTVLTLGEGYHNFHHAFPWDYRLTNQPFCVSARVLEILAYLGLAYDLKMVTPNIVRGHAKRHGDTAARDIFVDAVGNLGEKQKDM